MKDNGPVQEIYAKSNNCHIVELGRRFRDYRIALRLTQKDVADQSGVSVMTIVRFETGKGGSIRLDKLVALFRAVQLLDEIPALVPEIPASLYSKSETKKNTPQRVRMRKDER